MPRTDACIEWVEHGIAKTLEFDPSGFLLGTEAVAVVDGLREIKAERDALVLVAEAVVNGEWEAARELSDAALERTP